MSSLEEKLTAIESKIITKDDLNDLFDRIKNELKTDFEIQLQERDIRISKLETEIASLKSQVSSPNLIADNIINSVPTDQPWVTAPDKETNPGFQRELLVVGDSIVADVQHQKIFPGKTTSHSSLPGAGCEKVKKYLEESTSNYFYKNIVVHAGTCDIKSTKTSPTEVRDKILDLLKNTKLNNPNSNVFFSALIPKYGPHFNPLINQINRMVFNVQSLFGFRMIFHSRFSQFGNIDYSLYRLNEVKRKNPVHLSTKGSSFFTQDIKSCIFYRVPNH